MKKFLILIIGLSLVAASCDTGSIFDFGGGVKGVFKSDDNGETFNATDKLVKTGDISTLSMNALSLDPSHTDTLYAATGGGIYKSTDAAASWTYILSGIGVADAAVDPNSPKTIFAAGLVGQNGKIIKSIDGGTSWVDIYTEPSSNNTVLSVQVSNTNSSVVLAGLLSGELIRSTDSGRTWQAAKDFGDKVLKIRFGPSNSVYALTSTKGLFKSSDAGVTWMPIADSLITQTFNSADKTGSSVTAFDDLALDIRQPGVLYLGTEQGLYRTVNDGKDWSFLALPLKNSALRVSSVTVNPDDSNNLYASVVSTVYESINGGATWEIKTLPTTSVVHTIVVNPASSNIIYLGIRSQ